MLIAMLVLTSIDHEKFGADYLRKNGFTETIPNLIENHVKAKRYLAYKYPNYINKLSKASYNTLLEQGNIMDKKEAEEFEQNPLFSVSVQIRHYDEEAKYKNIKTNSLLYYKKKCYDYLMKHKTNPF